MTYAINFVFRSVCDLGRATALRAVRRVAHALHSLAPQFIKWPTGERAKEVTNDFVKFSAFPNVIGAIDGTHITINAPRQDPQSYINRKKTYSVQVQVSIHKIKFVVVFCWFTVLILIFNIILSGCLYQKPAVYKRVCWACWKCA